MSDGATTRDERRALRERIRAAALDAGFVRAGFASLEPFVRGGDALRRWLAAGKHGEMNYMRQHGDTRTDPRALLPAAKCALVVVARYADGTDDPPPPGADAMPGTFGHIARYARGADYHNVLRARLFGLVERIGQWTATTPAHRVCVDSAPLLERELAARAGVGFIGKNTMLISPGLGSYTVLASVLLDLDLGLDVEPDEPATPRCGSCELCLRACPTDALQTPYELDARRCISYITIEQRGDVDDAIAARTGDWVFGCDDCNQVCPFNRPTPASRAVAADPDLSAAPERAFVALDELLALRSGEYRRLVRGRALGRAPRRSWQRNAAMAARNAAMQARNAARDRERGS